MSRAEEKPGELAHAEFWDAKYSQADGHEWFKTPLALEPFLARNLFTPRAPESNPRILHLGSGDSTVPADLAARGYHDQTCIDFSSVVVAAMAAKEVAGVSWLHGDIRDMPQIATDSVDVAFDKGTLDAMIYGSPWSPPEETKQNASRYMREVSRVLKPDGVFLYVTFRQPHFVKPLLNADGLWAMECETLQESEGSFEYYAFVIRHAKTP